MQRAAACSIALVSLFLGCSALAGTGVHPGQWTIDEMQQICLKSDGTWYGTTFNFDGTWTPNPFGQDIWSALVSNYKVSTESAVEHANDTITVTKSGTVFGVFWYDWYDDLSYGTFIIGDFVFVKNNCDPPFKGQNTHAATQSAP